MINTVRSGRSKRLPMYANTQIRRYANIPMCYALTMPVGQRGAYCCLLFAASDTAKGKTEQSDMYLLHHLLAKQQDGETPSKSTGSSSSIKCGMRALWSRYLPYHP